MLKKLVKYGNSNALIFDKAILELLNIEEGAILKIRTDGTSIILTPQTNIASEKISETYTSDQAFPDATMKEMFKHFVLPAESQKTLEAEYKTLLQKHTELSEQLTRHAHYNDELAQFKQNYKNNPAKATAQFKTMRYSLCPALKIVEQELDAFLAKLEPFRKDKELINSAAPKHSKKESAMYKEDYAALASEISAIQKKYEHAYNKATELANDPAYLHEMQLLTEKYNVDKNSTKYITAINELNNKYNPDLQKAMDEMKAIVPKYTQLKK